MGGTCNTHGKNEGNVQHFSHIHRGERRIGDAVVQEDVPGRPDPEKLLYLLCLSCSSAY
jgi:hypothetical protein